jgi:hypothetical protein
MSLAFGDGQWLAKYLPEYSQTGISSLGVRSEREPESE